MTDWLDPRTAFAVFLYALGPVMALIAVTYGFEVLKWYAPPVRAEVLKTKRLDDGRWLLSIRWQGKRYTVVGEGSDWTHRRSGRRCKSSVMRGWLMRQWEELDRLPVEPEPLSSDEAEEVDNIIRMEEVNA